MLYNIINSVSYVLTMSFIIFMIKIFIHFYNYSNVYLNLIIISSMAPITLLYDINYNKGVVLDYHIYKCFAIPAVINVIEELILNIVLLSIPMGLYIIGRTSSSIFNIIYYKIFENKPITTLNKIAVGILLISYVFMFVDLIKLLDYTQIGNLIIVLLSGISTTLYNVISENQLKAIDNNKKNYMIRSNTIFQLVSFMVLIPICSPFVDITFSEFSYDFYIICIASALSAQVASMNKYYILDNIKESSLLIAGLDLSRRVFLFVLTASLLNESYSIYDTMGYILVLFASILMVYNNYKHNKINVL